MLRAIGFARWRAAAAVIDSERAMAKTDEAAAAVRLATGRTREALALADRRDTAILKTAALGRAWLCCVDTAFTRLSAGNLFGRWAGSTKAQVRCDEALAGDGIWCRRREPGAITDCMQR